MADDTWYLYDQFSYSVISSYLDFQCQILKASPQEPFLSFTLQIQPALVRKVSADILDRGGRAMPAPTERSGNITRCAVSALDGDAS
ncbi:hypothetical protein ABIA39_003249 [Nocardia sp. GAS34]